ncbi:hypothetical protein NQZ68_029485 [Dissostichus eleginoides]|uniref:Skeletal organic matrix protein 6 n=1 Tax=Dissostichus eleginoides TaxID=100907 RepID=A0AAD9FCP3_DISEL|nr:hypothetical protein NQZ68_029485 [Dissostichus eleginoides]KAK1897637.1 putative skeletal organic matrix protein 6 [Dissostichus eleginoides]
MLQTPTTNEPNEEFPPNTEKPSSHYKSANFYDTLVIEEGPEFVHHNLHKGWVYVWFLPSDAALTGLLMFCYILLVAAGLFLIFAAMFCMYRLNNSMDKLKAECAHPPE